MANICPNCGDIYRVKNGRAHQMQRYKCKTCGCSYTKDIPRGYGITKETEAVREHLKGSGFRQIERKLGISHVTVMRWVKDMSAQLLLFLQDLRMEPGRMQILDAEELRVLMNDRKKLQDSGWMLVEMPKQYFPPGWTVVVSSNEVPEPTPAPDSA